MTTHVRRGLLCLIAGVLFVGVAVFFAWPESKFQTLPLANGAQIRFLGATDTGTNHWNPTIRPMQKSALHVIGRLPQTWAPSLSRKILRRPENTPVMAVTSGTPALALWFWSDFLDAEDHIIVRCVGENGEELSPAYNVQFSSASGTAVVWLMQISEDAARRVKYLEVSRRNAPLRHDGYSVPQGPFFHALNPISELELDPGSRVGRFAVVRADR